MILLIYLLTHLLFQSQLFVISSFVSSDFKILFIVNYKFAISITLLILVYRNIFLLSYQHIYNMFVRYYLRDRKIII